MLVISSFQSASAQSSCSEVVCEDQEAKFQIPISSPECSSSFLGLPFLRQDVEVDILPYGQYYNNFIISGDVVYGSFSSPDCGLYNIALRVVCVYGDANIERKIDRWVIGLTVCVKSSIISGLAIGGPSTQKVCKTDPIFVRILWDKCFEGAELSTSLTSGCTVEKVNDDLYKIIPSACDPCSLYVTASDRCATNADASKVITRLNLVPGDIVISGDPCNCNGVTATYVAPDWLCGTIEWEGPAGWTVVGNGNTVNVTMPANATDGQLCARVTACNMQTVDKCITLYSTRNIPTITSATVEYHPSTMDGFVCPERSVSFNLTVSGDVTCIKFELDAPSDFTDVISEYGVTSVTSIHIDPSISGCSFKSFRVRAVNKCGTYGDWFTLPSIKVCGYDTNECKNYPR